MDMPDIFITLKDGRGNDLPYRIDQIFFLNGSDQMYGAAVYYGVDDTEAEIVLLRCDVEQQGEEAEFLISDIPDEEEYKLVAAGYEQLMEQEAAVYAAQEQHPEVVEDLYTFLDPDGNAHNYIAHMIFKDEKSNREYIALQEVGEAGLIDEAISIFRFSQGEEASAIDMIPSDMEFERARQILIGLIEADAGESLH